jgi:hypothetical protein
MTTEIKKPWNFGDTQTINIRGKKYNVYAAIKLSEGLEVRDLPMADFNTDYLAPNGDTLRSFVEHIRGVLDAGLEYPILLNENGAVIDGRHRLAKAMLEGRETIKTRRFKEDPSACWEWD